MDQASKLPSDRLRAQDHEIEITKNRKKIYKICLQQLNEVQRAFFHNADKLLKLTVTMSQP